MRCLLVLVLALPGAAFPQTPNITDLEAQLQALKERPEELWVWLNTLVLDLNQAGRYQEAFEVAKVNLELAGKIYPRTHPRMVKTLGNLGQMYINLARYEEGEPYLWEALSRATEAKRADKDMVALANNLGDCQASLGKFQEAVGMYERAIKMNRKLGAGDTPHQAIVLDNLGETLLALGQHDDALTMFQAALTIYQKHLPLEHPDFAETIGHIAALHVARGDLTRAESYFERLIAINQSTQGRGHPNVAKTMRDLAQAYNLQGRHQEAEHLMHHALQIMEATFGEDHANLAPYLEEAGRAKLAAGDAKEAEDYFTRALAAIDKATPESLRVASIADNLASAELMLGKLDEAQMHASRALAIVEKDLPPGHTQHITVLSTISTVMFKAGKLQEAERLNRRLMLLLEDRADLASMLDTVYENEIGMLRKLGREKEALDVERKRGALMGRGLPRY